jgi:hypothetical protein
VRQSTDPSGTHRGDHSTRHGNQRDPTSPDALTPSRRVHPNANPDDPSLTD